MNDDNSIIEELVMPPRRFSEVSLNGRHKSPRRSWLRRFYVTLRKLVRRRQESAAMRTSELMYQSLLKQTEEYRRLCDDDKANAKAAAERTISKSTAECDKRLKEQDRTHSEAVQKLERKIVSLEETLRAREKMIRDQSELTIPTLKSELKVSQMYVQYLETLVVKKLSHEQAQIEVNNRRIADAVEPMPLNSMQQILRGEP